MKTKIIIAALILFITIGIVAATDINNLKCPDGWESVGGGSYHEIGDSPGSGSGQNMMIMEYTDANCAEFFENSTEDQYTVVKDTNNTYMFIDGFNQDAGCFEVVKIDNKEYFLIFSTVDYADSEEIADTTSFMVKFNELNNLEPIAV